MPGCSSLTIHNSLFEANSTINGVGGGLLTLAPTFISDSEFRGNVVATSTIGGGAIRHDDELVIVRTSFFDNSAENGGAISGSAPLTMVGCTVSGSQATESGGGLFLVGGAELSNVTITDNTTDPDGLGRVNGGGFFNQNLAPVDLRNSIVAGNHDGGAFPTAKAADCAGEVVNHGWTSIGTLGLDGFDPACVVTGVPLDLGGDPGLGPLSDNGGPTLTHELLISSPNIDTGDPLGCVDGDGSSLNADQRGSKRVATCDRGAFEVGGEPPLFADDFESGGLWMWSDGQ